MQVVDLVMISNSDIFGVISHYVTVAVAFLGLFFQKMDLD